MDIVSFGTALTAGKHKTAAKRGRTYIYGCEARENARETETCNR